MNIKQFIFELGHLRRIKHEGWRLVGWDNPDSVAEHSLRAAQIAFILAKMENYDNPYEVVTMAVFHDRAEARIGDLHKMAARYVEADEKQAAQEQVEAFEFGAELQEMWEAVDEHKNVAGTIAKDADYVEQIFMARELVELGYATAQQWIVNASKRLRTKSAQELVKDIDSASAFDWYQGLKKLPKAFRDS